jgi:hypothetical protein
MMHYEAYEEPSSVMDRSIVPDKTQPPLQTHPYDRKCWSYMKFNSIRGYWFRVKIPPFATPGSKFVVKLPERYSEPYTVCTVPETNLLRPPSCPMERGGGIDEILISYVGHSVRSDGEVTQTNIVQALRVKKDNPFNCFSYLLPIPLLCILYPLCWADCLSNGCCEELEGLEWTESIQQSEIGSMSVVTAVLWDRQICNGDGSVDGTWLAN